MRKSSNNATSGSGRSSSTRIPSRAGEKEAMGAGTSGRSGSSASVSKSMAMSPKMPAAFQLLSRKLTQRPVRSEPRIDTLEPMPVQSAAAATGMRGQRPLHRRISSKSCDNLGIAFSSPAEALSLQKTHSTNHSEADLEDVLNLYRANSNEMSEHDEVSIDDRHSPPSIHGNTSTPRTTPFQFSDNVSPSSYRSSPASLRAEHVAADVSTSQARQLSAIEPRDRYGFRRESQFVNSESYAKWSLSYEEVLDRRRHKWDTLLSESGLTPALGLPIHFPPKSAKVQRYVRKGIPPEYRGQAWFFYANGPRKLRENPGLYDKLRQEAAQLDDTNAELIERDLHRTFPDNVRFKPDGYVKPPQVSRNTTARDPAEPVLIKSLRRVLQAFAHYRKKVGYCQSLNFIAGLFLLFLDEEKSFWMLVIITTDYLPNVHDTNLEGANIDQAVLMLSIKESLPAVWAKMGGGIDGTPTTGGQPTTQDIVSKLPPITLVTAAWFMSAFTGILPIETTLRVWDCFFYEGSKILFRMALTILKLGEPKILAVQEFIEIFQIVQSLPKDLIDPGVLMEACFRRRNGFGHLSQKDVDQRRTKVARMRKKSMSTRQSRDDLRVEMEGSRQPSSRSIFRR